MNSTVVVLSCCVALSRSRRAASFSCSGATAMETTASPRIARWACNAAMADSICSADSSMVPVDALVQRVASPIGVSAPQGTPANAGVLTAGGLIDATPEDTDSTFSERRQPDFGPPHEKGLL